MTLWWAVGAAWAFEPAGAILRASDRAEVGATQLAVSVDGGRVLVWGPERATLLGVDGTPGPVVKLAGITRGDVATTGQFALTHDGGVTVHGEGARELVRLAAFGRVHDVAISPNGRQVAIATVLALTVNDSVSGKTLWSTDGETLEIAYDAGGGLWARREEGVVGFDGTSGRKLGTGSMPKQAGQADGGCVLAATGPFCPVPGTTGAAFDHHVLLLNGGAVEAWHLIDASLVSTLSQGGAAIRKLSWIGTDLLVARADGALERRGADGSVVAQVAIPDCTADCKPMGLGPAPEGGFWAMASDGSWLEWDALGAARSKNPKVARVLGVDRLSDGRWASLDAKGRVRLGSSPGKGQVVGTVKPGVQGGVAMAGEHIAVWNNEGLVLLGLDGRKRSPSIGAGRLPVAVALSPDGSYVAMIDDGGALHAYRMADGGTVFRITANLKGSTLSWDKTGTAVFAGSEPLRAFGMKGEEMARVVFAPGGAVEAFAVSPEGTWAVAQAGQDANGSSGHTLLSMPVTETLPAPAR